MSEERTPGTGSSDHIIGQRKGGKAAHLAEKTTKRATARYSRKGDAGQLCLPSFREWRRRNRTTNVSSTKAGRCRRKLDFSVEV